MTPDLVALLVVAASPFVGSFLAVVAVRWPDGWGIVFGRSACPCCGHRLGVRDLIPIWSWVAAGRHCRYCTAPIAVHYPVTEGAAILVAVLCMATFPGWGVLPPVILGWWLLTIAAIDARHLLIPDALALPLAPLGIVLAIVGVPSWFVGWVLAEQVMGACLGFLTFLAVRTGYRRFRGREGMGLGDVKFAAVAGALLGWRLLPAMILLAALAALGWVLLRTVMGRPVRPDQPVPFGTFMAVSTWILWIGHHEPLSGPP